MSSMHHDVSNAEAPGGPAEGVRARRARLRSAMDRLEAALASPAHGRFAEWLEGLRDPTDALVGAIRDHVAETEADDGLLGQIVHDAPRLANDVARLRGEHDDLAQRCAAFSAQVEDAGPEDLDVLRADGLSVLGALARHRQTGSDLLYDAYLIDVGTGD